jgi:hypothetical protein
VTSSDSPSPQEPNAGGSTIAESNTSAKSLVEGKSEPPETAELLWRYSTVESDLDEHDESYSRQLNIGREMSLLGARVRGRKHKHEGANCDDWFEFDSTGRWSLIAVSDGAGSATFSRVGAKAACRAAIAHLRERLGSHDVPMFNGLTGGTWVESAQDALRRGDDLQFTDSSVEAVQVAIHGAMHAALGALQEETERRANDERYVTTLGRPLVVNDLSCTLLLVVHATIHIDDQAHSFVLSCQVGDGISAAIHARDGLKVLGIADAGGFSGETDFVTSIGKLNTEHLRRKTYLFFGRLRALMVMTDGVADDYFPLDPELRRLYADLVLNGCIPGPSADSGVNQAEQERWAEQVATAHFTSGVTVQGPGGGREVAVKSAAQLAQQLRLTLPELVERLHMLTQGLYSNREMASAGKSFELHLLDWLDAYYCRGSFDDRTLVLLY